MDVSTIIEYVVLATVVIILIHLFKYLYLDAFIYLIQVPMIGSESIIFPQAISSIFRTIVSSIVTISTLPLIYIIVFYLLSYGVYLLIKWILNQGWLFFIHPLVNPLLDVPPFKQLIKFGVFRLIEGIFGALGISSLFGSIIKFYVSVYIFSYDNTRYIFNLIAPNLGDKIVEYLKKHKGKKAKMVEEDVKKEEEKIKKEEEEKKKKEIEEDNKAKRQIEKGVETIVANKIELITPDLDATEKNKRYLNNNNEIINAYSKKIGDYIKLNY